MGHKDRSVHLATVSGVASTKPEIIRWMEKHGVPFDIFTTKSYQVRPNPGNREPVICETGPGHFGNSVGLRNPGMDVVFPQLQKLREDGLKGWLNVSVSADNPDDFATLVRRFDSLADSIELNFSCPHAKSGYGASIGVDKDIASDYVRRICALYPERQSLLFVKLTPNVDNIGEIAKAVIDAGADGISAINTVGPVTHIDPVSGQSILNSAKGGKGGKSGLWVREIALKAVKEIRQSVGDDVPVIGMGGVWGGADCAAMVEAGADAVGIGSVLAHVGQPYWHSFLNAVAYEAEAILNGDGEKIETTSSNFISKGNLMEYKPFKVIRKVLHSPDTVLLTLDGSMNDFHAGEFVFLWIPGIGEKPFSVAKTDPLTFIIKKRGQFTQAVFDTLKEGDSIYLRGPYGDAVIMPDAKKAIIICGGTGEAVALPLANDLSGRHISMSFLVGTSVDGNRGILEKELSAFGPYRCISDSGKPGRVLDSLDSVITQATSDGTALADIVFCLIGPEIFMKIASDRICSLGVQPDMVMLSMEKNSMCGVGLCGECSCGGTMTCQYGTFMNLSFLRKENVL